MKVTCSSLHVRQSEMRDLRSCCKWRSVHSRTLDMTPLRSDVSVATAVQSQLTTVTDLPRGTATLSPRRGRFHPRLGTDAHAASLATSARAAAACASTSGATRRGTRGTKPARSRSSTLSTRASSTTTVVCSPRCALCVLCIVKCECERERERECECECEWNMNHVVEASCATTAVCGPEWRARAGRARGLAPGVDGTKRSSLLRPQAILE